MTRSRKHVVNNGLGIHPVERHVQPQSPISKGDSPMRTFVAMNRTYLVLTIVTTLVIGGATLARLAGLSGTAIADQVPGYVPPPIVVDLVINDSTEPTEAN